MIMSHPENGRLDSASSGFSIDELKKAGWVEVTNESVKIEIDGKPKGKPGRKPKNFTDGLGDGNSSTTD